jgi:hypothetical protein
MANMFIGISETMWIALASTTSEPMGSMFCQGGLYRKGTLGCNTPVMYGLGDFPMYMLKLQVWVEVRVSSR